MTGENENNVKAQRMWKIISMATYRPGNHRKCLALPSRSKWRRSVANVSRRNRHETVKTRNAEKYQKKAYLQANLWRNGQWRK
jgi:hypothetical protein